MSTKSKLAVSMSILSLVSVVAMAQETVSFEATADLVGKYVWRGQLLNDDMALQPGISAAYGDLTVGVWGSYDLTDFAGERNEFTEVDYYLDYSGDVPGAEGLGYSFGYIFYDFPTTQAETEEIYAGLSLDTFLSPSVTVYADIDDADGFYFSGGITHTLENVVEIAPDVPVSVDLSASLGWGDKDYNTWYWGTSSSELNDLVLSAAFPFELFGFGVTPSVTYVSLVGSDVKASNTYSTDNDYVYLGIGCSRSF